MGKGKSEERSGYLKRVNYKTLSLAVAGFTALILIPVPESMLDVGVEYAVGRDRVRELFSQRLFGESHAAAAQWQAKTADVLEALMMQGVSKKSTVLKRDRKQIEGAGVEVGEEHFARMREFIEGQDADSFEKLMREARTLRHDKLSCNDLTPKEQAAVERAAHNIQVCVAMAVFVIVCFVTEAIPLPGVAFAIGLILVFSGVVTRRNVASLFWSDAVWFIMGSLMFAAAFVKTGVDKRICLALFRRLATPSVRLITAILILVIAPAASFISDHALAAIFLPIGIILYTNSLYTGQGKDSELAKMLMICIAMACNIGGFGSPSGGARNVVIMTYLEDMFGITVGYGEWMLYGLPFVIVMMPVLWVLINWRFKPRIVNLGGALAVLKSDIDKTGGWTRPQIIAIVVFLTMLFMWITEKNLISSLLGVRLGIGVVAVAGAVAYLLLGIVSWQDYQEKVDWGVVWLYAGATIFGRVLDETGAAYWAARSVVEGLASVGAGGSHALIGVGSAVTAVITNLMADGPAAASIGPITLNMAAVTATGTTAVPFMGLATACASSFAYLLVIGTPPNAIVYASGFLEAKDFLRVGIPCFVVAFIVLMLMVLFLWPIIGFQGMPSP